MKRCLSVVLSSLVLLAALSGCGGARRVSRETNQLTRMFQKQVEAGKTTRAQEQAYIKSVSDVAYQLDRAIRGTKAADQTRREVETLANNLKLNEPLNLDKPDPVPIP